MQFQVDVSRLYKNKTGYDVGGYKLNTSFVTENHTEDTFLDTIKSGWPYTMVHKKTSPKETGADVRKVSTPKHIENFISSQILTLDDDRGTSFVVSEWLDDPFFEEYGFAFIESTRSTKKEQKGHAVFLFDKPITDPALYKDCLRAACTFYKKRVDWLVNVDRTIYNGENQPVHKLGNICPFEVFETIILDPWRNVQIAKSKELEEKKKNRKIVVNGSKNLYSAYLSGYIDWLVEHVASKSHGDNRNIAVYWAGRSIAGIQATEWCLPYLDLLNGIESRIITACIENGYYQEYAHTDNEIERIFNRGILAGGEELEQPTVENTENRIVDALGKVKPALTPEQKLQAVIHTQAVIEQLAEEKSWIKFNRLIKEFNINVGLPESIIDHFSIGYRPSFLNKDTGEIIEDAITLPYYNENGEVVSVEYRIENEYSYEGIPSLYKVKPMFDEELKGSIILPDSLVAINYYLQGSNSFSVYGLPHENDFTIVLPDQERYCIFDSNTDVELLKELSSHNVKFVKVSSLESLVKNVKKADIERLATRGKKLAQIL